MMAEKARMFEDEENLNEIMDTDDPREQKRLGRLVVGEALSQVRDTLS